MSSETLTSASSSVPGLPFDLVVEILSRLPVKSLMQLRCVCKSWKSLISDPKFAKKQLCASMSITCRHHLMLTFERSHEFLFRAYSLSSRFEIGTSTTMQLEYPLEINRTGIVHFAGSCHGILCFHHDQGVILLWNPSIRKFTKLSFLEEEGHSSFVICFGYDNFSDSYKVVVVSCYKTFVINGILACKYQVNVHTLGTNSWRKMQDLPFGFIIETGIFVSGTINWLVSFRDGHPPGVIVSLDFEKESYQELLLPDFGGLGIGISDLWMFKDCLCILSYGDTFTDIWLMKEFGNKESWTKLFRLPTKDTIVARPLYFSEDDQVLLGIYPKLVICNSRDGTFKFCSSQNINSSWVESGVYLESLISPCF